MIHLSFLPPDLVSEHPSFLPPNLVREQVNHTKTTSYFTSPLGE